MTGIVKWFRDNFGIVMADDKGPDVFVHVEAIKGGSRLSTGMEVEFDVHPTYRHPKNGTRRALTVRAISRRSYEVFPSNPKKVVAYGTD